ncbi:MAG TPA: hypothetical protein VHX37_07435 [Acidobacteriaceae bacterium]|jgi:hypothetical protein|nr:hypothetical protein [Acidobacteriaceae bacterium]
MTRYAKLTITLIAAWFVVSLAASALHLYQAVPGRPPLALGIAALTPLVLFFIGYAAAPGYRAFIRTLDPRTLTLLQSWRIAGFVFVVLAAYGILPNLFAQPAGWGDFFIGATAPLAALVLAQPSHRSTFVFWQILGMADLITAVTLGPLAQVIHPQGLPTSPMTVLPLSMIPTFAVPLFFLIHFICISQALRWPASPVVPAVQPRRVPAL